MKRILCMFGKHDWIEEPGLDSDWGGILHAYYCSRCGLIKHVTFNNEYFLNRYYVEWFAYTDSKGVHIDYDTVMSVSIKDIIKRKPRNAFVKEYMADAFETRYYTYIEKIKPEHLMLNNYQISKLYSYNGDFNERKRQNQQNTK